MLVRVLLWLCTTCASLSLPTAPLFEINVTSLFDAGVQHGTLARTRINGWLLSEEMQYLKRYVASEVGQQNFQELKQVNSRAFPQYAEEIRGIAQGAAVSVDDVWTINLLYELEAIAGQASARYHSTDHCSDVYAVAAGGYSSGFAQGHNEDWSEEVKPFFYWIKLSVRGMASCAGLAYPGTLIGYGPTWNEHGMFWTMNSVFPLNNSAGGMAVAMGQRAALCPAASLGEAVEALAATTWSSGGSLNLVDLHNKAMANYEFWEGSHAVTGVNTNYTHFNMYVAA
jgi:hypothetical protein